MDFETFRREVGHDPYSALVSQMRADAFREGLRTARRAVEDGGSNAADLREMEADPELPYRVLMTEEGKRERERIVALASIAPHIPSKLIGRSDASGS